MKNRYIEEAALKMQETKAKAIYFSLYTTESGIRERLDMIDINVSTERLMKHQIGILEGLSKEHNDMIGKFLKETGFNPEFEDSPIYKRLEEESATEQEVQKEYDRFTQTDSYRLYDKLNQLGGEISGCISKLKKKQDLLFPSKTKPQDDTQPTLSDLLIIPKSIDVSKEDILKAVHEILTSPNRIIRPISFALTVLALWAKGYIAFEEDRTDIRKAIKAINPGKFGTDANYNATIIRYTDSKGNPIISKIKGYIERLP